MQKNSLTGSIPDTLLKLLPEIHQNVMNTEAENDQNISSLKNAQSVPIKGNPG